MMMMDEDKYPKLDAGMDNLRGKRKREKVVAWAEDISMQHGLLEDVLAGHMEIVDYDDKEGPKFRLTPKGTEHVETNLQPAQRTGADQ